jgi:glycosyltransferase involved in cell wall biosynthesis
MLISVYIPTRNRQELLRRAVDSVLTQTYKNIELIVVNDASTDGTDKYLQQKARDDSRLIYFTNLEPRGASVSRNIAILKSRGAFVTGLDDDDLFLPERIAAFVEYWNLLISKGVSPSCLYSQATYYHKASPQVATRYIGSVTWEDLVQRNWIGNQVFAPKENYIEAGLFNEELPAWQDLEFFIRLLKKCGPASLLDIATYCYDASQRSDRISARPQNIRQAFEIVANKHFGGVNRRKQALALQMFSPHYGIRPNARDWIRFIRWGFWPEGWLRLVSRTIKPIRTYDGQLR